MEMQENVKRRGNEKFEMKDYEGASKYYSMAIQMALTDPQDKTLIDTKDDIVRIVRSNECLQKCLNNRAQCCLYLKKYNEAVEDTTTVLLAIPNDTKALYRRCQAYKELNLVLESLKDAERLIKLEPKNKLFIERYDAIKSFAKTYKSECVPKKEALRVLVVTGENVEEQLYPVEDFSEANCWHKCEAAHLLGIPLVYKRIDSSPVTKKSKKKVKELAQVLLVKPDYSLLNGPAQYHEQRFYVPSKDKKQGFEVFKWSDKAWKVNTSKPLGVLMFARTDETDATENLFWDLFDYIYDIMEYYRHGSAFKTGIEKTQKMISPKDFAKYHSNVSNEQRNDFKTVNIEKFPDCISNTEAWW